MWTPLGGTGLSGGAQLDGNGNWTFSLSNGTATGSITVNPSSQTVTGGSFSVIWDNATWTVSTSGGKYNLGVTISYGAANSSHGINFSNPKNDYYQAAPTPPRNPYTGGGAGGYGGGDAGGYGGSGSGGYGGGYAGGGNKSHSVAGYC